MLSPQKKKEMNTKEWEKEFDKWYEDETEYTATTSQISKWWLNKLSSHTQDIRDQVMKLPTIDRLDGNGLETISKMRVLQILESNE